MENLKYDGRAKSRPSQSELDWESAVPHSTAELRGHLFEGWYQPKDIVSYPIDSKYYIQNKIDMKSILDELPQFILAQQSKIASGNGLVRSVSCIQEIVHYIEGSGVEARTLSHHCTECDMEPEVAPSQMFLMIEYMILMSVPLHFKNNFECFRDKLKTTMPGSRPQSANRKRKRWVFVPCFCEPEQCFANYKHSMKEGSYIPILVVPAHMYERYLELAQYSHVIMKLPEEVKHSTGYARYWIQKVAKVLRLEVIWVVDDQVKGFYESIPCTRVPLTKSPHTNMWALDKHGVNERLRSFEDVFSHLEGVMDAELGEECGTGILGVSNEVGQQISPFSYDVPYGAVLMNIKELGDTMFHPELHQLEMQVFGCEAVKAGLRVFTSNLFVLLDSGWNLDR